MAFLKKFVKPSDNAQRRIYPFIKGKSDGGTDMKALLGGKGANLCEMAKIGLNVPAGFVITTETCEEFQQAGGKLPDGLWEEVLETLSVLEQQHGGKFGNSTNPLLISIRSGAALSMPGMMDTVLNVGLNDEIVVSLAKSMGERFALDCYRRLLDMYGDVVLGIEHSKFEEQIEAVKAKHGVKYDLELGVEDMKQVVQRFKQVYAENNLELPSPYDQLKTSIAAVFSSWNTPRAVAYRKINKITHLKGTAVNVQCMVFGNRNDSCATGVCFTRNPATGEPGLYGEFLINAQGEDVVAGIRTPLPIHQMKESFPEAYADLVANTTKLETHLRDMQDCEFTVENNKLFMLQTRNGKRTGAAALRVAVDMQSEGLVSEKESILMVEPRHLEQLLHPTFASINSAEYKNAVIAKGLPASPGAACGKIVFTPHDAEAWQSKGELVILVRTDTSPEDVGGMHAAVGILTARGGMTSHAAVVARGWGKPCVAGCEALAVDEATKTARFGDVILKEGDWLCLNGTTGEVIQGQQPTKEPEVAGLLSDFLKTCDKYRRMAVMTNCDTPEDAAIARKNGAQGIGLVRTEHMFFKSAARINAVRRMIAAEELNDTADAEQALAELEGYQRSDYEGIFEAMDGLDVTIRLLDPPLHEFLPSEGRQLDELCAAITEQHAARGAAGQHMLASKVLRAKLAGLHEANPMMGLRGCRLGIVHPEISTMQAKAILSAAANVTKAKGVQCRPHIMVPLVGFSEELSNQLDIIHTVAAEIKQSTGANVDYRVGSMLEVPRGCLAAGDLVNVGAQFFSFGSNDLTQMSLGFSRDDAEKKFLHHYIKEGILKDDPFDTLDQNGVGELMKIAVQRGRAAREDLTMGICGEHGGDPRSIEFCESLGLNYVSCSPLRIPVARLAAAQAAVKASLAHGDNDHCQD